MKSSSSRARRGCRDARSLRPRLLWLAVVALPVLSAHHHPPAFSFEWGSLGTAEGEFDAPSGVELGSGGQVYVVDDANHRVQKFDADGGFQETWGWGVDDGTNAFQVCTAGCQAGIQGSGQGQFTFPQDLVADPEGNIYVADSGNQRVQKFDGNGGFLAQWGSQGAGEGEFNNPLGIAIDNRGVLYVTEQNGHRVQEFDLQGTFLRMWGWGVQDGSSEFQVCTSGCQIGLSGTGEGQFFVPDSLDISGTMGIYVIDSGNDRVQKFQVPLLHFLVVDARGPVPGCCR